MLQNIKKRTEGFTIIEVLIVLAIAGLIMIIIFFAVPALQRNSRNTQLRNDANVVLGYINEYMANNNGQTPSSVTYTSDGTVTLGTIAAGKIRGSLGFNGTGTATTSTGTLVVALNTKCNGTALGTLGATQRAVAVQFMVETSGTPQSQCVES